MQPTSNWNANNSQCDKDNLNSGWVLLWNRTSNWNANSHITSCVIKTVRHLVLNSAMKIVNHCHQTPCTLTKMAGQQDYNRTIMHT